MADIASARQKVNDIEVSNDAPVTEDLLVKIGANINDYLDKGFRSQEFTSNGSWTCPTNVTKALLIGSGGGGGGTGSNYCAGGCGAPLGVKLVTVVPATVYGVTIGAGGSGGVAGGGDHGLSGSATTFGGLATFLGGRGGIAADLNATTTNNVMWFLLPSSTRNDPVGALGGTTSGGPSAEFLHGQGQAENNGGTTGLNGAGGGAGPFGAGASQPGSSGSGGTAAGANTGAGGSSSGTAAGAAAGGAGGSGKLVVIWWGNS